MLPKAASYLLFFLLFLAVCVRGQNTQQVLMRLLDSLHTSNTGPFHQARTVAPVLPSGANQRQTPFRLPVSSGSINRQQNTVCHDTSERFLLATDTLVYYTNDPYQTADGNYLVSGQC